MFRGTRRSINFHQGATVHGATLAPGYRWQAWRRFEAFVINSPHANSVPDCLSLVLIYGRICILDGDRRPPRNIHIKLRPNILTRSGHLLPPVQNFSCHPIIIIMVYDTWRQSWFIFVWHHDLTMTLFDVNNCYNYVIIDVFCNISTCRLRLHSKLYKLAMHSCTYIYESESSSWIWWRMKCLVKDVKFKYVEILNHIFSKMAANIGLKHMFNFCCTTSKS